MKNTAIATNMAKLLPSWKVLPGFALDLTTTNRKGEAWDFTRTDHRKEDRAKVDKDSSKIEKAGPAQK